MLEGTYLVWVDCSVLKRSSIEIVYPGYRKSSYCAERFVKNIDIAIENEKKFCEDINELEHTVGSNIGVLIEEMRRH